jgi:hypothetical protein
MAATNVQAFSGDVELNDRLTINSSVGNIKKKSFTNYNGNASIRYWKVASGNYDGSVRNQVIMTVNIHRVDRTNITRRLVMEADFGALSFNPCIDEHDPGQSQDLRVYKNTSDTTFDIYLQLDSYTYVDVEMTYSGTSITVYDTPTWESSEPTTSATYILEFTNGNLNAMKINNAGNVGIGTTSPDCALSVTGSRSTSSPGAGIHMGMDGTSLTQYAMFQMNATDRTEIDFSTPNTDANGRITYDHVSNYMNFRINGVDNRLFIKSDGNVGIGTDDPGTKLEVNGDIGIARTAGAYTFREQLGGDIRAGIHSNASNELSLRVGGDSEAIRIDVSGNVGIGTDDPGDNLHIYENNTSAQQLVIQNDNQSGRSGLSMVTGTGATQAFKIQHVGGPSAISNAAILENFSTVNGGIHFYAKGDGDYIFRTTSSNSTRMTITNDGKVGIGAFTPSYDLHVSGSTKLGKTGVNTNPGNEGLRVYTGNYPAARFEALHSLGLISIVRAHGSGGYNTSGDYNNNAVYRSDLASGADSGWKHFSAISNGGRVFYVSRDGSTISQSLTNLTFDFFLGNGDQTSRGDSGSSRALVKQAGEQLIINYSGDFEGGTVVQSSFSKSSGSFRIDHPLPEKEETHHLVHSFIEGPQADNLYRGIVQLVDGVSTVNIDETSRMTEGTFVALNRRTQCFTTNETDWDAVRGTLNGNILEIECQNTSSTATVSWLVIGERRDKHMFDTRWTDEEGRVITEPLKDFDFDDTDYLYTLRDVSDK